MQSECPSRPSSDTLKSLFIIIIGGVVPAIAAPAATYSPLAFTKWLDEHEGWKGSRRSAIVAVKRMFNWAVKEAKLLRESPLRDVRRPPK